jgi:hypothetical protein
MILQFKQFFFKKEPAIFFFNDESEKAISLLPIFKEIANMNKDDGLVYTITAPNDGHK